MTQQLMVAVKSESCACSFRADKTPEAIAESVYQWIREILEQATGPANVLHVSISRINLVPSNICEQLELEV